MNLIRAKGLLGLKRDAPALSREGCEVLLRACKYLMAAAALVRDHERLVLLSQARERIKAEAEPRRRRRSRRRCPVCGDPCHGEMCRIHQKRLVGG